MKKFKVIIICLLIVSLIIPAAYAYWTDAVNTKINVTLTYDGYLNVLNVPVPVPEAVVEEAPPEGDILAGDMEDLEEENSDSENKETLQDGESISEDLQEEDENSEDSEGNEDKNSEDSEGSESNDGNGSSENSEGENIDASKGEGSKGDAD